MKKEELYTFIRDADVEIKVALCEIGYQADVYIDGNPVFMRVRDFSGTYRRKKKLKEELAQCLLDAVEKFRGDK